MHHVSLWDHEWNLIDDDVSLTDHFGDRYSVLLPAGHSATTVEPAGTTYLPRYARSFLVVDELGARVTARFDGAQWNDDGSRTVSFLSDLSCVVYQSADAAP